MSTKQNPNEKIPNEEGILEYPLVIATRNNNHEEVIKLLQDGAIPDNSDNGLTPLYLATFNNNYKIAKILIEGGAGTNIKNNDHGEAPLFQAIRKKNIKMVNLLIKNGPLQSKKMFFDIN